MIRFGPAGLGSVKDAVETLKDFHSRELKACEIAFTYGVYIKESQTKEIEEIKKTAKELDIKLSIHAPYWVNLNSAEKKKIEDTKKRILDCCKISERLGVEVVVFHPGYYGKMDKEKTFHNIKEAIIDMQKQVRESKWKVKLAPETMGKVNVFGDIDEILRLVKEADCSFCIDFAHLIARSQGKMKYEEMYNYVKNFTSLHCHFSGINYGEKGEKNHIVTPEKEIKELLSKLPKNKDITIINESPDMIKDSVRMLNVWKKI